MPACSRAHALLGEVAWRQGELVLAADHFQKAAREDPSDARSLAMRAGAMALMARPSEALAAIDAAQGRHPREGFVFEMLGVAHSALERHRSALACFEQATALEPGVTSPWRSLGHCRRALGDRSGAREAFQRAIAIDPSDPDAHLALASMDRQTARSNTVIKLEALWRGTENPAAKAAFAHAIAKSMEDLGLWDDAYAWLVAAKQAARARAPYSPRSTIDLFEAAKRTASLPAAAAASPGGPIFICGLPRSGTTLVERILTRHPAVRSVGESMILPEVIGRGTPPGGARYAEALGRLTEDDLPAVARDYIDRAQCLTGEGRFVDKQPFNFLHAAVINAALPGARVVLMKRGALDVCVGAFRQLFSPTSGFHAYAHDLDSIARYAILFDDLTRHWTETLPSGRFLLLSYEELIRSPEHQIRRLLRFCGLGWDKRCLSFERNRAPVASASLDQVRTAMNTDGVGRWRRFATNIAPVRKMLEDAGVS